MPDPAIKKLQLRFGVHENSSMTCSQEALLSRKRPRSADSSSIDEQPASKKMKISFLM